MREITVREIHEYFGYRMVCGNDEALNRVVTEGDVNRPGLELSGYFELPYNRIVIIGEREIKYINTRMSEEAQRKAFDYLTRDSIPFILISRDQPCPKILYDIAYAKNFPIFSSYAHTNSIIVELLSFLEEALAPIETLHGVLMQVYGRGVLVTGDSGIGKSEIALEMIKKGHILVADDRVDVYRAHNQIIGKPADVLKDMLELRGVGLLNIADMFGGMSTTEKTDIDCIVNLCLSQNNREEYDRLGMNNEHTVSLFGIEIPKLDIPVGQGRSVAAMIEAAVSNIIMRQKGRDSAENFRQKLTNYIESNKEEEN
ncbi:MAG: HPr(Ser) kinase/phosphatase [Erysipelotrichaceae bacterium]|nr:HPr(Ser) kinase/phosphatase [Erysipelotrichaceae bacterium]